MRVLVVHDGVHRVTDGENGLRVSGHWWRPGKGHDTIRVHHAKGMPSAEGGRVVRYERTPEGRTLVVFAPDPAQAGRPWPAVGLLQGGFRTVEE